jgi:hypothetical protein
VLPTSVDYGNAYWTAAQMSESVAREVFSEPMANIANST